MKSCLRVLHYVLCRALQSAHRTWHCAPNKVLPQPNMTSKFITALLRFSQKTTNKLVANHEWLVQKQLMLKLCVGWWGYTSSNPSQYSWNCQHWNLEHDMFILYCVRMLIYVLSWTTWYYSLLFYIFYMNVPCKQQNECILYRDIYIHERHM